MLGVFAKKTSRSSLRIIKYLYSFATTGKDFIHYVSSTKKEVNVLRVLRSYFRWPWMIRHFLSKKIPEAYCKGTPKTKSILFCPILF